MDIEGKSADEIVMGHRCRCCTRRVTVGGKVYREFVPGRKYVDHVYCGFRCMDTDRAGGRVDK